MHVLWSEATMARTLGGRAGGRATGRATAAAATYKLSQPIPKACKDQIFRKGKPLTPIIDFS